MCRGLPLDERQSAAELEAVLQHHHNLQEKLADDMLNLARNLKNNTLAAQNIIKQDNQVTGWINILCVFISAVFLTLRFLLFFLKVSFCCLSYVCPLVGSIRQKNILNLCSFVIPVFTSYFIFFFPWQTLSQSMRQADLNFEKLKTESERLEQHTKKSVNWLLWLMLILVSFTFISMILFIRIFPRLRWWRASAVPNS